MQEGVGLVNNGFVVKGKKARAMDSKQKGAIAVGRLIHFLSQYGIYVFTPLTDGGPVDLIAMEDAKLYKFQCKYRERPVLSSSAKYSPEVFDFLWVSFGTDWSRKKRRDFLVPSCAIWKDSSSRSFSGFYVDNDYWSQFAIQNLPQPFKLARVYNAEVK